MSTTDVPLEKVEDSRELSRKIELRKRKHSSVLTGDDSTKTGHQRDNINRKEVSNFIVLLVFCKV
jgi:hypothetical protein